MVRYAAMGLIMSALLLGATAAQSTKTVSLTAKEFSFDNQSAWCHCEYSWEEGHAHVRPSQEGNV